MISVADGYYQCTYVDEKIRSFQKGDYFKVTGNLAVNLNNLKAIDLLSIYEQDMDYKAVCLLGVVVNFTEEVPSCSTIIRDRGLKVRE